MKNLLQNEIRELIPQIDKLHQQFGEDDIRGSFLDGYFQILRTYYCSHYHLDSADIVEKYQELYQRKDIEKEGLDLHLQGHKNLLNSFLIINCWSNFELFVTLFSQSILSDQEQIELLEIEYLRIKNSLKGLFIDEETDTKLRKFTKKDLAHVPMPNKYGKLLKMINPYPTDRNKQNDRDFLEFFGRLRNCIHSNYIFYGAEEKRFYYNGEDFIFKHGDLLSHDPSTESSIFLLTLNIKKIFFVIINNIIFDAEIFDPSVKLIKE